MNEIFWNIDLKYFEIYIWNILMKWCNHLCNHAEMIWMKYFQQDAIKKKHGDHSNQSGKKLSSGKRQRGCEREDLAELAEAGGAGGAEAVDGRQGGRDVFVDRASRDRTRKAPVHHPSKHRVYHLESQWKIGPSIKLLPFCVGNRDLEVAWSPFSDWKF